MDLNLPTRELQERMTEAIEKLANGQTITIEYGVRWVVGQESSAGERVKRVDGELFVGAATNLVVNVGVDNQLVTNSFDNIEIFNTKIVQIGDNVLVERPLYYHKHEFVKEDGIDYEYHWMCDKQLFGYIHPIIFKENKVAYLARYTASETAEGIAKSVAGETPWCSIKRENARIAARKNDGNGTNTDSKWGLMDAADYYYHIYVPFLIEFATKNSQSVYQGVVGLPYEKTHLLLYSGTGNEVVLTKAQAELYAVGQTVSIGTERAVYDVVRNRYVEEITLDYPNVGEGTIKLSGEAITFASGNVIFSFAWRSGMTDNLIASSGCYKANTAKYPISFRNYENPFGNTFEFVDGLKITNYKTWVCEDRTAYNDIPSSNGKYAAPYYPVSYDNAAISSGYAKELGYDKKFPYARITSEIGGSSSTYLADYYYADAGDRTVSVGGDWSDWSNAGLSFWNVSNSLTNSHSHVGFRLSYHP